MKIAIATLRGTQPYSPSRYYDKEEVPRINDGRESDDDYRKRTWMYHCHFNPETGECFIPPNAFKNMMAEAAKFKPIQIPGKGRSTYTKHFEAGIAVGEPVSLGVLLKDVKSETLFLPADGKRGGSKRVKKTYPKFDTWNVTVRFLILDETITEQVFRQTLKEAGEFIGLGRFRPRNNGYYGRFMIESLTWSDG